MLNYQELREKYKPKEIKCLLIAESPPGSEESKRKKQNYQRKFKKQN